VGLPYGLLYFLLCIILLLLIFIFLRDRDLRSRLNDFFSGAKRRMKKARLRLKLNRETRKRIDLLKGLGERAWREKIQGAGYEPYYRSLSVLEAQSQERQSVLRDAQTRVIDLQRQQEEARQAHKQLMSRKEAGEHVDDSVLRAARELTVRLKRDIRDEIKWISVEQETLRDVDRRRERQFESLGELADAERPDFKDTGEVYAQIDILNRKILHYMSEIEKLR
jgi:hypothetical protein